MSTTLRHGILIIISIAAFVLTWPYAYDWMRAGGNILNPVAFFRDAIVLGKTAAFLSLDAMFMWLTYMIWVLFDAQRIGLGPKWGVFFIFLSYLGVSMAFPVYIVVRERHLDKRARSGSDSGVIHA